MTKRRSHRRHKRERARTQLRRRERAAAKRAAKSSRRQSTGRDDAAARPRFTNLITPTDGSAPHFFDDCPICRAMKETGATPDATGVVSMTAEQHAQYKRRLDEIVADEGWPDEAMWVSGEQMRRTFEEVNATLAANGYPTDMDAMDDDELDAHMERVMEVIAARESADRDRAAGMGNN